MLIKVPPGWRLPDAQITPEASYWSRRELVKSLGLTATGLLSGCGLALTGGELGDLEGFANPYEPWFPVAPNDRYLVPERPLSPETAATQWNNFYEFTLNKGQVWQLVGDFEIEPWTLEIDGMCHNPGTYDLEELFNRFAMQERTYRFRCVERWAMTVPWSGFPFADLVDWADPFGSARYVQMTTAYRPEQMPGLDLDPRYPWPYTEALSLEEATNELTMLVAGIYGRAIPRQNGAPLRLIVPWKYGYKNIKSIVRLTFTEERPTTFWNTVWPGAYGFESNVDPEVPHPSWSQEWEWLIPDGDNQIRTQKYNGYGEFVSQLYR